MTIFSVLALVFIAIPAVYAVVSSEKAVTKPHFTAVLAGSAAASLSMLVLNALVML